MELTPLERLLYEIDPLGKQDKFVLTLKQLEDLVEAIPDAGYDAGHKAGYTEGYIEGYDEGSYE